jgi:hypothetical protein
MTPEQSPTRNEVTIAYDGRELELEDLESILRAPERLRALALDLEEQARQALNEGHLTRGRELLDAADAALRTAKSWEP